MDSIIKTTHIPQTEIKPKIITFVGFGLLMGFILGLIITVLAKPLLSKIKTLPYSDTRLILITPTPHICIAPQLPKANNSRDFERWKNPFVSVENHQVVYSEIDVKNNLICKYILHISPQVKNPSFLHLHTDEPYLSYLDDGTASLHIFDINSGIDKQIHLGLSDTKNIVYDIYYDDHDYYINAIPQGSTIIVVPHVFYGGCEEDCDQIDWDRINNMIRNDWKDKNVMVTIARTRGTYMQIPREKFPFDFDFSHFQMNYDKQNITFSKFAPLQTIQFSFTSSSDNEIK